MQDFGQWSPDKPDFENDGLTVCTNVLPGDTTYLPIGSPQVVTSSSALNGRAIGAIAVRSVTQTGITFNFVGTTTKLYLLNNATFEDVSKAGGYSGQSADEDRWDFAAIGNDIIATNFQDEMQHYNLVTSSVFADLAGSPPKARHIAKIGDFLVCGNTNDTTDGFRPQRVRWAGIGTIDSWTVSGVDQADYNDLNNNYGWIQQIIGGDFGGLVFQEYGIIRMTYVGSPLIFQFDEVKGASGLLAPDAAQNIGDGVAYLGQDGFYITDGQTSVNIGAGKVNRYFFDDHDPIYVNTTTSFLYERLTIVGWSYRSKSASGDYNDKIIFYNFSRNAKKRWSIAGIHNSIAYLSLSEGYTLEELDCYDVVSCSASNFQTLETLPFSLDSKAYQGNEKIVGIINDAFRLATLTGTPLTADIEAGEVQPNPGAKTMVTRVRPYYYESFETSASTTLTMDIGYRDRLNESAQYSFNHSPNANGDIPARASGRYLRFRFNVIGDWEQIQGYEIQTSVKRGRR